MGRRCLTSRRVFSGNHARMSEGQSNAAVTPYPSEGCSHNKVLGKEISFNGGTVHTQDLRNGKNEKSHVYKELPFSQQSTIRRVILGCTLRLPSISHVRRLMNRALSANCCVLAHDFANTHSTTRTPDLHPNDQLSLSQTAWVHRRVH